jgi:endonuclease YncB( thermonuclease family)
MRSFRLAVGIKGDGGDRRFPARLPIGVAMRPCLGILSALALTLGAASATAATGPCRPDGSGPTCRVWKAKVTDVNDGDTLDVDIDGDGTRRRYAVRFIGVQAMEQTRYSRNPAKRRGQCHALQATNLVERLVRRGHRRVRLTAQSARKDSQGRLFRSVAVKIGGRWQDVGEIEMARGVTLWMHVAGETAWNRRYNALGQEAARKGIGLWNPQACGSGPRQEVPFRVWVMSDPLGEDTVDVNSEYVRIQNQGATAVSLARWWIRDSGLRRYTFPPGTVLAPGRTITVHSGRGTRAGDSFHWGLPGTVFENSASGGDQGDGAYLFDPQGDLRGHLVYPCLVACSDPNQGAVSVTQHAVGREYLLVRNVAPRPVDLYGYELRLPGGYAFGRDAVLMPGETMEIQVKGDPGTDTRLVRHMGIDAAYLPDRGGAVSVTTFDEIVLDCDAWGSGRC